MLLTWFRFSSFDFELIIFVYFACISCFPPLSSAYSYLVRFEPLAQSYDIRNYNFVSLHSGLIITDFNEAADTQYWQYFSYMDFWFGYLVDMTCSKLQELTLVVFFRNLFQFITVEQVTLSFWLLRLVYCIAGITLFYFSSHKPLFVSGWVL